MTINRTTLLDLPLPVTGTESGVWGDVVNNGLSQYIDISVAGSLSLSADSDTNLSSTEGDASATNIGSTTAQYAILRCTGARTATRNINAPAWAISGGTLTNYSKIYIVVNETTGSQNIVLRATNSATPTYTTGVTIVPGERAVCAWNGSDFVKVGGAAGGSTTQVQFNNAGVFGGITNATTDGTTLSMTSPKVITGINDTNGNELLKVTATASAVNELTLANAATGGNPVLSATGGDTNIGITLTPKGTGGVVFPAGAVGTPAITTTGDTNTGVFFPAADTAAITTGGSERMRILSGGKVLINATTDRDKWDNSTIGSNLLQVERSASGGNSSISVTNNPGTFADAFSLLYLGRSRGTANNDYTAVASGDGLGVVSFQGADGTEFVEAASIRGYVDGTPGANDMPGRLMFFTTPDGSATPAERMRIDSSGNVGIGVTPSAWNTVTAVQVKNASFAGYSTTNAYMLQNAYYASGWKYISNGGATRLETDGSSLAFSAASSGTAGNAITFTSLLAVGKDQTVSLQGATSQSGTGITFPATQSASSDANTLDDYEEGTWTPALKFGGNSTGMTISATGKYTKIGNVVYWTCDFALSAKGSSTGSATITGLPFTSFNGTYSPAVVWAYDMASLTGSIIYRVASNSTTIDIYQYDATGSNNVVTQANFNNASQNRTAGFYFI